MTATSGGTNTFGQPISVGGGSIVPTSIPGAPTPTTTQQKQATEPAVLSSATHTEDTNPQNQQKLADITTSSPASAQNTDLQTKRENGGSYQAEDGNTYYNFDSTPVNGGMIPGTNMTPTGDPGVDNIFKQFSDLKTQMDATSAAYINNIHQQYAGLVAQQKQANAGQEAAVNSLLLRSGSMQTASSAGIFNTQVGYGLQQISDLQQKENDAVIKAQQAQEQGDMELLDKQLSVYDQIRQEKQAAAQKLNDQIAAQKQKEDAQRKQASKDSSIATLMSSGVTDPKEILKQLQASGDDTVTMSDIKALTNDPMTSTALSWAQEAAKNGADPALIQKALTLSKTDPTGALSLLSGSLVDPMKAANDKIDLEQKKANLVKTNVDIENARAQNSGATTIDPGTPQFKVAQDLAYGNLTMQQFRTLYSYSRNINQKLGIYQLASQLNPNFNPAAFELGFTFASNPKIRQQVTSLDNVQNMLPDIIAVSDKAARSNTGLNSLVIKGGIAIGSTKYSNMQLARTAFADELSGALGYGSATDMSREMGFDLTNPSLSAQQFRDGMQQIVEPFVQNKRGTLINAMGQYGNTINTMSSGASGQGSGEVKFRDPKTNQVHKFTNLSPSDFQDAIKQGYTVVTQ